MTVSNGRFPTGVEVDRYGRGARHPQPFASDKSRTNSCVPRLGHIVTSSTPTGFLPLEVYELTHGKSASKLILLIASIAIVVYLIVRRWQAYREKHGHQLRSASAPA